MININFGKNKTLLDACDPMREYAWFVEKIREKQNEMNSLEAAIDAAISEMPAEFSIRAFLLSNIAEVKRMCITEYNEARVRAEDREEGRTEGGIAMLVRLIHIGKLTEKDAAEAAGMSVAEFQSKAAMIPPYAQYLVC